MYKFADGVPIAIRPQVTQDLCKELPTYNMFHRCITDFSRYTKYLDSDIIVSNFDASLQRLVSNRIRIADQLLMLTDPIFDFCTYDDEGLSVLHKSIICYDIEFTKFVVRTIESVGKGAKILPQNDRKKFTLNLNTRCQRKGWAPIHYAVERANIASIRLLAEAGANLQASSATDKKLIPIELAKYRIKVNQSNTSMKVIAEKVLRVLNDMILMQKTVNKESAKKGKVEQLPQNSEQIESGKHSVVQDLTSGKNSVKKKKKSISKEESTSHVETNASEKPSSAAIKPATETKPLIDSSNKSKKSQSKPSSANDIDGNPLQMSNNAINLTSRDEMVDHLLSMGFKESDCLQAITVCGTDIDRAISWLCERPRQVEQDNFSKAIPSSSGKKKDENGVRKQQSHIHGVSMVSNKNLSAVNTNTPAVADEPKKSVAINSRVTSEEDKKKFKVSI
jgi:hypothetical protein